MNERTNNREPFHVKPYTVKDLCGIFQVSRRTFYTLIDPYHDEIGKRTGKYFTVKQVEQIIKNIGLPYDLKPGTFED